MKTHQRDITQSFRIAVAMDPNMGAFSIWEPADLPCVPLNTTLGSHQVHDGWRKYTFDHSRLDGFAALDVLRSEPAGRPDYSMADVENDFATVRLRDLRRSPRRRLLVRLGRSPAGFAQINEKLPIARCLVRTDASAGSTLHVLSTAHELALAHGGGDYSSITVTVSASEALRQRRIGNWSSGYLSTVRRGELPRGACAEFLQRAAASRDVSLLRLSTYGKVEKAFPGVVASIGRSRFGPKEAAIITSARVQDEFGMACQDLYIEIPQRSPRSLSIALLRHPNGVNACVAGRIPMEDLTEITRNLFVESCDIVFGEVD